MRTIDRSTRDEFELLARARGWIDEGPAAMLATDAARTALIDARARWTYSELEATIDTIAISLSDWGVRPGGRVMIVCDNARDSGATILAVSRLGAWPVTLCDTASTP